MLHPPAAGARPSGNGRGRGSVGLGSEYMALGDTRRGFDLQAVYLGGAGEGEVIPVQGMTLALSYTCC